MQIHTSKTQLKDSSLTYEGDDEQSKPEVEVGTEI